MYGTNAETSFRSLRQLKPEERELVPGVRHSNRSMERPDDPSLCHCLMPGATDTEFFKRAGMMDTDVGTTEKDDPAEVARSGFDAMMKGQGDIVSGFANKMQSAAANVLPSGVLASQHREMAEPGSAKNSLPLTTADSGTCRAFDCFDLGYRSRA
jgi:hypothetical protein